MTGRRVAMVQTAPLLFDLPETRWIGGTYVVRVEDTDQAREVVGALAQFERAFDYFHHHSGRVRRR